MMKIAFFGLILLCGSHAYCAEFLFSEPTQVPVEFFRDQEKVDLYRTRLHKLVGHRKTPDFVQSFDIGHKQPLKIVKQGELISLSGEGLLMTDGLFECVAVVFSNVQENFSTAMSHFSGYLNRINHFHETNAKTIEIVELLDFKKSLKNMFDLCGQNLSSDYRASTQLL
jgi:hypothetical protein